MANVAENTHVSYDANLTELPDGAAWPTSVDAVLPAGSIPTGWLGVDGETLTNSNAVTEVRGHTGQQIVRYVPAPGTATLAVNALEDTPQTRKLWDGAEEDASGKATVNPNKGYIGTFVYDSMDVDKGFEKKVRYVFKAYVTANGDKVFAPGAVTQIPLLFNIIGSYDRMVAPVVYPIDGE